MQRHQRVGRVEHAIVAVHATGGGQELDQRVDHHVADAVNLCRFDPLAEQVAIAVFRRREEQVGQLIGHQPVDFFRHRPVARSEPRLDVRDRDEELRADERGGGSRVDVAVDDHQIRLAVEDDRLEAHHDLRRLGGVGAGADREIEIGFRNFELLKKDVRHERVVVLTGVDERLANAVLPECGEHGSGFHEIRSGTDNVENVHAVLAL